MTSQKKKLKVKLLQQGELEYRTCSNCKHFLVVEGKAGICKERETVVYGSYCCPLYEEGKPMTADLNVLAEFYVLFKEAEEEYKRNRDFLRDVIINKVKGKAETEEYIVNVQEVTANRLNTKKVRDYLKRLGILEEFLERSKYYRVEVKKKLS